MLSDKKKEHKTVILFLKIKRSFFGQHPRFYEYVFSIYWVQEYKSDL